MPVHRGQCYCGQTRVIARTDPQTIAYCHCTSCRRQSGAPVSAFAAFAEADVHFEPSEGSAATPSPGVSRAFCSGCGSATAARYVYLEGQVYVPIGLFDQPSAFEPISHSHAGEAIGWLHLSDDLPRSAASDRDRLRTAK